VPAPAAVDRYVLPAERSAANPPHAAVAVERQDRQVNGRPLHRPRSSTRICIGSGVAQRISGCAKNSGLLSSAISLTIFRAKTKKKVKHGNKACLVNNQIA